MTTSTYPRPDFQRPSPTWLSLNGPWSFLFDDNDTGLTSSWHKSGLPPSTNLDPNLATNSTGNKDSEAIVAKIAGGTQELLKGNFDWKKSGDGHAKMNEKREIIVPYAWQTRASGIAEKGVHEVFWYERNIVDPRAEQDKKEGKRVLLRFGAVDYEARVWIDGNEVGGHRGGHVPFDIDITDSLTTSSEGEKLRPPHRLTIRVFDSAHDLTQPRGKQYWGAQPESIFYTPSGGIWQSVWLEVVPWVRIGDSSRGTVVRGTRIEDGVVEGGVKVLERRKGGVYYVGVEVGLGGLEVGSVKVELPKDADIVPFEVNTRLTKDQISQLSAEITQKAPLENDRAWLNNVALWSPEHPTLYDLTIRLYDAHENQIDSIHTTTGMRSLSWNKSHFYLNNKPYFQALFLDQGYWPSTFMTPPTPTALKDDILLSKKMGFNGCRKHQKVEDPLFHYWADHLGFLVWGEMANAYQFSAEYVERFNQEWTEAVLRDRNHPCVVTWTPVNESWAYTDLAHNRQQRDHIRALYYLTKSLDPTRPINDNCGWEHVHTDLTTFHDYSDAEALTKTCSTLEGILSPKANRGVFLPDIPSPSAPTDPSSSHHPSAPIICTEFGGINVARPKPSNVNNTTDDATGDRDWGYTTASDPADLLARIEKMMMGIVQSGIICGFVYTQLTDIEQEVNGLYTLEREEKLDSEKVRGIVERVMRVYYERVHQGEAVRV